MNEWRYEQGYIVTVKKTPDGYPITARIAHILDKDAAMLIAAAPALLEAVGAAINGDRSHLVEAYRLAIKKTD